MSAFFTKECVSTILWTAVATSVLWIIGYLAFAPDCLVSRTKQEGFLSYYTVHDRPNAAVTLIVEESEREDFGGSHKELFHYPITGPRSRYLVVGIKRESKGK